MFRLHIHNLITVHPGDWQTRWSFVPAEHHDQSVVRHPHDDVELTETPTFSTPRETVQMTALHLKAAPLLQCTEAPSSPQSMRSTTCWNRTSRSSAITPAIFCNQALSASWQVMCRCMHAIMNDRVHHRVFCTASTLSRTKCNHFGTFSEQVKQALQVLDTPGRKTAGRRDAQSSRMKGACWGP